MTRFSKNRGGVVVKVEVKLMQQQRISVKKERSSTKSPATSTITFIIEETYHQFHIPVAVDGLEGTITSPFKGHYWGEKAEEVIEEHIIHMVDIIIIENPNDIGKDVNEPVKIVNKIII
uniref:C1 n=1 Tax=Bhendi yellow vein mosaic betasatellite TaxID=908070 RepID=A0A0M4AKL6_9VIRU|nr:C1 [Bhendi yellow vein mosaic betasatellite]